MSQAIINFFSNNFCCCYSQKSKPEFSYICIEGDEKHKKLVLVSEPSLDSKSPRRKIKTVQVKGKSKREMFLENLKFEIYQNDFIKELNDLNPSNYYEKICDLGEGSFGQVIKVKNVNTESIRAMKIMMKGNDMNEEEFLQESETLKSLSHPNIIKIFEIFKYQEKIYLVEEYVKGGDLFSKVIKLNNISERITLMIMKQIFSAVYYLHYNNIIHGDLKLENIMVESLIKRRPTKLLSDLNSTLSEFDIKIIDFGCSTFYKNVPLKKLIGTLYYLAPEVIHGSYNNKCDIWSCGVIMYALLSGYFPFNGESSEEIMSKILKGKFVFTNEFSHVSEPTKDLIRSCLELDPYKRISAAKALDHKCFKLLENDDSNESDDEQIELDPVIHNLKNMKRRLTFQKAIIKFMTFNLFSSEEVATVRNFYKKLDDNNDGYLTTSELKKGLFKAGKLFSEDDFEEIISELDPYNTGIIEYEDFIACCVDKEKILKEDKLKAAFNLFDTDKSGGISVDEIKSAFNLNDNSLDSLVCNQMKQELHITKTHSIKYEEFKSLVSKAFK